MELNDATDFPNNISKMSTIKNLSIWH